MSIRHTHRAPVARDTRSPAVVAALVGQGLVAPSHRDEALRVVDDVLGAQVLAASAAPLRRRVAELAGYVGAALVVSAAGVFFATQWNGLTEDQRILLLGGIALLLAVSGLAVVAVGARGLATGLAGMRAGTRPVQRRLAGVLFVGAAATAGGAVGVQVERMVTDPASSAGALWGFAVFTVLAAVGYLVAATVAGQAAIAIGLFVTVPLALDVNGDPAPVPFGLTVLAIGVGWLVLAERGVWREVGSARVIGCALAVVGAQIPVLELDSPWVGYLALLAVAAAGFAMYVVRTAWPYLATGVVAVTLAVPQALLDWAGDTLGPAGVLLAAGVTLLGTSLLGLRLRQEATDEAAVEDGRSRS
jgi:hypothetical protein